MKKLLITVFAVLALVLTVSGCTATGGPDDPMIDSLTADVIDTGQGYDVQLDLEVANFEVVDSLEGGTGDGYYVFYMDTVPSGAMGPTIPGTPTTTVTPTSTTATTTETETTTTSPTETETTTASPTETETTTTTTTTGTETTTTSPTETETTTTTTATAGGTIIEVLEADGQFTMLLDAIEQAGLTDTLEGEGPYTLFAPTDDAFGELPEGTLEGLSADELENLLLYHVVGMAYTATDLESYHCLPSLYEGTLLNISSENGAIMVNDAEVIGPDLMATNGVTHAIDMVLMPPEATPTSTATTTTATATTTTETETTTTSPTETETTATSPTETETTTTSPTETETTTTSPTETETTATSPTETETTTTSPTETETTATSPTETETTTATTTTEGDNIIDVLEADGRFATLLNALEQADLTDTLMGIGPYTLFAPTDEAFEELPEGALDGLTDEELTNILLYHVLDNVVDSGDVMEADALIPLTGETIFVTTDNDTVMLNDSAEVIETDITASNGMIHVIDAVLMPPEVTSTTSTTITGAEEPALTTPAQTETPELTTPAQTETPTGTATTTTETETTTTTETTTATATATGPAGEDTIAGILENDGRFSTLLGALQQAGLAETLEGDGPFTVFAPTDEAFAALPEGLVESLSSDQLEEVLLNHVASGIMTYKDLALLTNLPSLSGGSLDIYVTDIMIGDANFIETDIMASNGIIHVIDAVLVPEDLTTPTTTTTTATTTTSPTETETTTTSPTETETTTASPTETETMTTTTETETTTTSPTETETMTTTTETETTTTSPTETETTTTSPTETETTTTTAGTETTTTSPTETETTTTSPTETATTTTSPDQVAGFPSLSPSYTFEDVPPGYHVFAAQLVDPEGNPLTPPVVIAVLIPVPSSEGGSSQTTTPTSPTTTTTPMNQP